VPEVLKILEQERGKKQRGQASDLMDILIAYRQEEMFSLDAAYYRKDEPKKTEAGGGA
jgi:complex iron-sulfur molybdoenzyme family reductase subunit beta